jgi:alkyl hydroperoxide reductase subunit AhpC
MTAYNGELEKFAGYDAQVVGMSVDSIPSHIAWQQKSIGKLNYPLASDFWPHGAVAEKYGVLRTGEPIPGINERAIFIVDKDGKVAFAKLYDLGEQPDSKEFFAVLKNLQLAA